MAQVFPCEFCKISKNPFFTEHLWATTSTLDCRFLEYFESFVFLLRIQFKKINMDENF